MVVEPGPSSPNFLANAVSTIKAISEIRIRIRAEKLPYDINLIGDSSGQSSQILPALLSLSWHQHHRIEGKIGQYGYGRTLSHQN